MPANMMYVVVGMKKVQGGGSVYEVISSRYARVEMPESKVKKPIKALASVGVSPVSFTSISGILLILDTTNIN